MKEVVLFLLIAMSALAQGTHWGRVRLGIFRNKNVFRNIFRLFCSWEQNSRMESRFSGMRITPKQTLTCIIPIILIPDWSQTNAPWITYCDIIVFSFKVAQDSFQHFPRRRFWWVIITTLYRLMLQSWYQKAAQSLVNTSVLFSWHYRLP